MKRKTADLIDPIIENRMLHKTHKILSSSILSHDSYSSTSDSDGESMSTSKANYDDEHYLYKAKKYHHKCQAKLMKMMSQGIPCPTGYERYLRPFYHLNKS